jgi:hypothetical protein
MDSLEKNRGENITTAGTGNRAASWLDLAGSYHAAQADNATTLEG